MLALFVQATLPFTALLLRLHCNYRLCLFQTGQAVVLRCPLCIHCRRAKSRTLGSTPFVFLLPVMIVDGILDTSSFRVEDEPDESALKKSFNLQRRHNVDFLPDSQVRIIEFEANDEMYKDSVWYSRDEYDIIKARNQLIVKMMKTGHFRESEDHTIRGLEHKLKERFRARRENKFNALNAVLEEQDRQIARGNVDATVIAEKYRRACFDAAETAGILAMKDAEESYCYTSPQMHISSSYESTPQLVAEEEEDEDDSVDDDETDIISQSTEKMNKEQIMNNKKVLTLFSGASRSRNRFKRRVSA